MTILVTGSTGAIGSQVVAHLAGNSADVQALTRAPEKTQFPAGVTPVKGDLDGRGRDARCLGKGEHAVSS